ncbi:Retrovirus-related Pol polyprotein LINE-1 [Cricetulus griseus]|uniref:Retrovirus-related Pol polyprotein LINE-1 n=1 Tax=Cricetulus griseus TaxID=10029 RepID=G3HWV4_CRIGR|nr:Retrovirus-related Pol polyprotein LINE-1 [Cricetulus griseus]
MNTEEIQRVIRSYFENLYSTKLGNLMEKDIFLDRYQLPKLIGAFRLLPGSGYYKTMLL